MPIFAVVYKKLASGKQWLVLLPKLIVVHLVLRFFYNVPM
jgi:hypothetical protein